MATYLEFSDLDAAVNANMLIFENLARTSSKTLRTSTDSLVDVTDVPAGDLLAEVYVIPGYNAGAARLDAQGSTTKWAQIHERFDASGKYVIPKPPSNMDAGVIDATEIEYSDDWYEDVNP